MFIDKYVYFNIFVSATRGVCKCKSTLSRVYTSPTTVAVRKNLKYIGCNIFDLNLVHTVTLTVFLLKILCRVHELRKYHK